MLRLSEGLTVWWVPILAKEFRKLIQERESCG
jgi:hypothetical protein